MPGSPRPPSGDQRPARSGAPGGLSQATRAGARGCASRTRADLDQDREHLVGRRRARALGPGRRPDAALGRRRVGRPHDEVGAQVRQRQVGQQGDAEAGGDEALHDVVVVGLEARPRARSPRRGRRASTTSPQVLGREPQSQASSANSASGTAAARRAGDHAGSARCIDSVSTRVARGRARRRCGTDG